MMRDDEWVSVEDPTTEETNTNEKTDSNDAYDAFVRNTRHPSPPFEVAGISFVLRHAVPGHLVEQARAIAKSHYSCNACRDRAGVYVRDVGPKGPVFLHNLTTGDLAAPSEHFTQLRALATSISCQDCSGSDEATAKPSVVVVTAGTYAPVEEGKSASGERYSHWTVHPSSITAPDKAAKFAKLQHYLHTMDSRLAKLCTPEAAASVAIMVEEQAHLERPEHYKGCLKWCTHLQAQAAKRGGFASMTHAEQVQLKVLAIMTGRTDGNVHFDFHQADNVVDFLTMGSRDELRAEMDARSHPSRYMVSNLNRKLAAAGVTSKHLIGLAWEGEYADDLDLHVITPSGREIYYGCKRADGCQLDFDANVNRGEANPCENVSCRPGTFKVRVNNFTRRTFDRPVPFQIICRQAGMEDVVYDGVWGTNRAKGNMIDVCMHTFTELPSTVVDAPQMSVKSASRANALDGAWDAAFGVPIATIATADTLSAKPGVDLVRCSTMIGARTASADAAEAGRAFMSLAVSRANGAGGKQGAKKAYLSERCSAQPTTVADLVAYLRGHPSASLAVSPRDHSPGYLVDVMTRSEGVRKAGQLPSMCHYTDKHAFPVHPASVGVAPVGNGRLDESWLGRAPENGLVAVSAVATLGGTTFLALAGAKLPPAGNAWPVGGGFYPTDLVADFHAHRERWAFLHTQLRPSMPAAEKSKEVAMVGTFMVGSKAVVWLNGVKLTLECSGDQATLAGYR